MGAVWQDYAGWPRTANVTSLANRPLDWDTDIGVWTGAIRRVRFKKADRRAGEAHKGAATNPGAGPTPPPQPRSGDSQ
jgi:hypothetical protein